MDYDVIVIGAGPGGLMAASECSRSGRTVLVLEKNEKPGKKLLTSGGGQCNLTNRLPAEQFAVNYYEKSKFVRKILHGFSPDDLINRFESWGVPLEELPNGKVFPKSKKAADVLQVLISQATSQGAVIRTLEAVTALHHKDGVFSVKTNQNTYRSQSVVLATGGKSYPALGSSGDGYPWARALGHTISPPRPALAAVHVSEFPLADLAGVTLRDARVSLWRKNRKIGEYGGDLLITHDGLSGPVILNNSRYFDSKDVLKLNLVKFNSEEDFAKGFADHLQSNGKYMIRKVVDLYDVPRRLLEKILELSGIPMDQRCSEISKTQRSALAKLLVAFPLSIHEVGPFEQAMVTAGGVVTDEVNSSTMESKLVPSLFFVGEVLDVDGATGGYNLQFAFSSAVAVAKRIG